MSQSSSLYARPEVLAPVGDITSLGAALNAGADAVYFGLEGQFNARAKSEGIRVDMLAEVVRRCHHAGAKALVTMNTLIFEPELTRVATLVQVAAEAGVDALIVQDPAVALLAREIAPELEVHASTQMTISSPESARFAEALGVTRIVVPRELTVSQIARFKAETALELEVFIHGALCMSWSGQCLTSEAWGGRSANRGQCAQSCRMPYDLIVDGVERPLGDVKYLLSPRDLAGVRAVKSLMEAGVECLKIEGRYKGPAYVQHTVETYQAWISSVLEQSLDDAATRERLARRMTDLSLTYSRGLSDGFLGGKDHQSLVEGRFPKHRGVFLGYVTAVKGEWIELSSRGDGRKYNKTARGKRSDPLPLYASSPSASSEGQVDSESADHLQEIQERERSLERGPSLARLIPVTGMGVVFDEGSPEGDEYGGRIAEVLTKSGGWKLRLHQRSARAQSQRGQASSRSSQRSDSGGLPSDLLVGSRVWVNHHPLLTQQAMRAAQRELKQATGGRVWVAMSVSGALDHPLRLSLEIAGPLSRYQGVAVEVESAEALIAQESRPLTEELLESKLTALGTTPFSAISFVADVPPNCGLPVSALKRLRRDAVTRLLSAMETLRPHPIKCTSLVALNLIKDKLNAHAQRSLDARVEAERSDDLSIEHAKLVPLCRTFEQLEALIACRARLGASAFEEVELDWMEFVGLRKAVERAREVGLKVTIATVRVQQPGEAIFDRRITSLKPDGVLLRHWGGLMHFASLPAEDRPVLHGDFSLNLTNSLSARHVTSYGLATITAAHDLDAAQLHGLLDTFTPHQVAVTVHHHIPTFHTEHCVYAHSLSDGRDSRSCGRPCDDHRVALRDHKGQAHPVLVDVKCRNTVFNASAQTAATLTHQLLARGVRRMRVEFVWEDATQTTRALESYHGLLHGVLTPTQVLSQLKMHERFGLTTGTMEIHR